MMRVYTSIFLSSLLVLSLGMNAKSFEARSSELSNQAIKKLLTSQAEKQPTQAQPDTNLSPERGSGR
ncbi:MAG: heterocyst-inhibiting protein PatX [Actinomycetota bacterium]